jgi:hypothetical protein
MGEVTGTGRPGSKYQPQYINFLSQSASYLWIATCNRRGGKGLTPAMRSPTFCFLFFGGSQSFATV